MISSSYSKCFLKGFHLNLVFRASPWGNTTSRNWVSGCTTFQEGVMALQWRHNERDGVSNHQPHGCLLNRLFGRRSKKTSKLRVTGLCKGNSPVTGEFPVQRASHTENVSIWWRHHGMETLSALLALCDGNPSWHKALMFSLASTRIRIYKTFLARSRHSCPDQAVKQTVEPVVI